MSGRIERVAGIEADPPGAFEEESFDEFDIAWQLSADRGWCRDIPCRRAEPSPTGDVVTAHTPHDEEPLTLPSDP